MNCIDTDSLEEVGRVHAIPDHLSRIPRFAVTCNLLGTAVSDWPPRAFDLVADLVTKPDAPPAPVYVHIDGLERNGHFVLTDVVVDGKSFADKLMDDGLISRVVRQRRLALTDKKNAKPEGVDGTATTKSSNERFSTHGGGGECDSGSLSRSNSVNSSSTTSSINSSSTTNSINTSSITSSINSSSTTSNINPSSTTSSINPSSSTNSILTSSTSSINTIDYSYSPTPPDATTTSVSRSEHRPTNQKPPITTNGHADITTTTTSAPKSTCKYRYTDLQPAQLDAGVNQYIVHAVSAQEFYVQPMTAATGYGEFHQVAQAYCGFKKYKETDPYTSGSYSL